jgi:hypothetical protein
MTDDGVVGGLRADDAKPLKDLERANATLNGRPRRRR